MAGGKETPRQKMIGMMYMVLTALLALNVSSTIIEKFVIIDDTLVTLEKASSASNESLANAIKASQTGGAAGDAARAKAAQVRELTRAEVEFLENVKRTMKLETPPNPPRFLKTGEVYKGPDGKEVKEMEPEKYNQNAHGPDEFFLSTEALKTVGAEFENSLKAYVDKLNGLVPNGNSGKPFEILNKRMKDFPEHFAKEAEKNPKQSFLEFYFQNIPLPAAVASISELQAQILEYEKIALDGLNKIVNADIYIVDQLIPMVVPASNSVLLGSYYEADMFLAGSPSKGDVPKMYAGGSELVVDKFNVGGSANSPSVNRGKVKIRATTVGEQAFEAKIVIPGRATPATMAMKFKVLNPVPHVGSVTGIQMFKDCGNQVEVTIPGMTDLSGVVLSLPPDQGTVTRTAKAGTFVVVPSRNTATLSISLEGRIIGTEPVPKVQNVPAPTLVIRQNGKDTKAPVIGSINLVAKANNELFEGDKYNADNQFVIQSFKYSINNGPLNTVTGANWNLGSVARPGDNIDLTNFVVVRRDYAGSVKPVNVSNMDQPIKIKR